MKTRQPGQMINVPYPYQLAPTSSVQSIITIIS